MRKATPNILAQTITADDDVVLAMGARPEAPAVLTPFRYDDLDPESRIVVQQRTSEIKAIMRKTAQGVVDIGGKLLEVKERLGHGRFGFWLDQEFGWSDRTARNFMDVARQFKSEIIPDLSIAPTALIALSGATVPQAARQEAIEQATNGQPVTVRQAKEIVAKHKPPRAEPVAKVAPPAPVASDEPITPYQLVQSWLASRFNNDGQRRFAVLEMIRIKAASQYWPSVARLLPGAGESDILMLLDAVRSGMDGASPEPARIAPQPVARAVIQPPAPRWRDAEERLEELRRRLADALMLPHGASDDELIEAVETMMTAWQLMEAGR